jgi:hypothetical protein
LFVEDGAGIAIHVHGGKWVVLEEKFSVLVEGIGPRRGRGVNNFNGFSGTPWPYGMWRRVYPGSRIEALGRWKLRLWVWYVCV